MDGDGHVTDDAPITVAPAAGELELPIVGSEVPPAGLPVAYRDEAGNTYRLLDSAGEPVLGSDA